MIKQQGVKILVLDIETAPIKAHVWQLFDQNVSLNQIEKDWFILSWSAKWLNKPKVHYQDLRRFKKPTSDKSILKDIWALMDEADIIVGQNSRRFDVKKLRARFILNGMKPPSSFRQIDTMVLAKKYFGFTSNKLEYMSENICKKFKKLKSKRFIGHELWVQCLKGNLEAFKEMERYNKRDVLATQELYLELTKWDCDNSLNLNVYHKDHASFCSACGHDKLYDNGFRYSNTGKFKRFKCKRCRKESQSKYNELSPKKRREMLK